MTWPRAFLPVPTSALRIDEQLDPGKRTSAEYRQQMASVPDLYALQVNSMTDQQFRTMYDTPKNETEKRLGEAYRHLFSLSPVAQPLRAEMVQGRGLVVMDGRHRVEAAKQLGLPYVPVHVAAPTTADLQRVQRSCEEEVARLTPELTAVVDIHRAHDLRAYPDRERAFAPQRRLGADRSESERSR